MYQISVVITLILAALVHGGPTRGSKPKDDILTESIKGVAETLDIVNQAQNLTKSAQEKLKQMEKDMDRETFEIYDHTKSCLRQSFGQNFAAGRNSNSYLGLLIDLYSNSNFSSAADCLPEKFDDKHLEAFSKLIFGEDEDFLKNILKNTGELLGGSNIQNTVRMLELIRKQDEGRYVTNIYIGMTRALTQMQRGESQGFKDLFLYFACLNDNDVKYGDLLVISPWSLMQSDLEVGSLTTCGIKEKFVSGGMQYGARLFAKGLEAVNDYFGSTANSGYGKEERAPAESVDNSTASSPDTETQTENVSEESAKEPQVSQISSGLFSFFDNMVSGWDETATWNTRIKQLKSRIDNNGCLTDFYEDQYEKLANVSLSAESEEFRKYFFEGRCKIGTKVVKVSTTLSTPIVIQSIEDNNEVGGISESSIGDLGFVHQMIERHGLMTCTGVLLGSVVLIALISAACRHCSKSNDQQTANPADPTKDQYISVVTPTLPEPNLKQAVCMSESVGPAGNYQCRASEGSCRHGLSTKL